MANDPLLEEWPHPYVAVDPVILTVARDRLQVLVYRRGSTAGEPHPGELALPGVFLNEDEAPRDAVKRAVKDKVNLVVEADDLELVDVLNARNEDRRRDPRAWVITVVYLGLSPSWMAREATEEAERVVRLLNVEVPWRDTVGGPVRLRSASDQVVGLAFDHSKLIGLAVAHLRRTVWQSGALVDLVREPFTLRQLLQVYEAVLGEPLSRTTFRRRMVETLKLIEPTGQRLETAPRRPELFTRAQGIR